MANAVLALGVFSAQLPDRVATQDEWFVECPVNTVSGGRDCEVAIELGNGDLSYHLGFIYRVTSGTFLAVGLPRPTRILARVDDGEVYEFGMCTGAACLLRGRIADQLRQRLQRGEILHLEFRSGERTASITEVSLTGFNKMHLEALDRLSR